MPHPVDIHVGLRIREARQLRGISQSGLAEKLDISFQQLQKNEKGTNRIGPSRLLIIAGELGVPVEYFFEGIEGGGTGEYVKVARRTLALAREIESIKDESIRRCVLELVRAASRIKTTP